MKKIIVATSIAILSTMSIQAQDQQQLQQEIQELKKESCEIRKQQNPICRKLKVYSDSELKELGKAMKEAQKAYNARKDELISKDPEGAELCKKLTDINSQIQEKYKAINALKKEQCKKAKKTKKSKKGKNKNDL